MQDNQISWKYVEPLNEGVIQKIEEYFKVSFPKDYIDMLPSINMGKPSKDCFDIDGRKECIIDYMIDLSKVICIAENLNQKDFIAIASDPFGNYIGYQITSKIQSEDIVFWDHETDKFTFCANSFRSFISILY